MNKKNQMYVAGFVIVALAAGGGALLALDKSEPVTHQIQEDDPDWDWKTDGNRTAGGEVTMFDGETFEVFVTVNDDGTYTIIERK